MKVGKKLEKNWKLRKFIKLVKFLKISIPKSGLNFTKNIEFSRNLQFLTKNDKIFKFSQNNFFSVHPTPFRKQ